MATLPPDAAPGTTPKKADLVLEGGGVKGIALVGAAVALAEDGYRFERVAGSSAGALVGAIIVAMQQRNESMSRVDDIMRTLDYTKMLDRRGPGRAFRWWPAIANGFGIVLNQGMYRGKYLEDWTRGVLADLGVHAFGDLVFPDPGSALEPEQSYRLVVTASDLSRQQLMYLPWDLREYGVDPDSYSVARAVRASAAIPFMFEPVTLRGRYGLSTLADGSLLRSYPIELADTWHPAQLTVQRAGARQADQGADLDDPESGLHDGRLHPGTSRPRPGQCGAQHLRQAKWHQVD